MRLEIYFFSILFDLNVQYYHQIDSHALTWVKTDEKTKLITFERKIFWTRPVEHLMEIRDKDKLRNTKTVRININMWESVRVVEF